MDDYRKQQYERRRQERIKRAKRKNMIIYVETLLILILTVALVVLSISYVNLKDELKNDTKSNGSSLVNSETASVGSENTSSVSGVGAESSITNSNNSSVTSSQQISSKDELDMWYMKLVNPDNSITTNYINSIERSKINTKYVVSATKETCLYLDSRIVKYFEDMCKAAKDDGITLVSVSAYRSYSYQQGLYNNRVTRCQNEDGLSLEAAKKKAATIVAVPGTSEHHLGLAVDINSVETSFEDTKAFRWLQENAEKYGFVMRYPKDKQDITKIIYEPWHYRYVGVEHAKAMNDLDMCLEEYVEYLKKK